MRTKLDESAVVFSSEDSSFSYVAAVWRVTNALHVGLFSQTATQEKKKKQQPKLCIVFKQYNVLNPRADHAGSPQGSFKHLKWKQSKSGTCDVLKWRDERRWRSVSLHILRDRKGLMQLGAATLKLMLWFRVHQNGRRWEDLNAQ